MVKGNVKRLLQAEGLFVLLLSLLLYSRLDGSWTVFAWCFLLPDVTLLAYLRSARVGAICYNITHSYLGPILLAAAGLIASLPLALPFALIWSAHVGFDRMLGYGLKYASGFRNTHLGMIGRAPVERA